MNILITICARGGSKGIPGKNIKALNGLPLLTYTINQAKEFSKKTGADIVLSTDDDEIKAVGESNKIHSDYVRPSQLAEDSSGKIDAISDVLLYKEKKESKTYDFILDLDVTSPLRTQNDLLEAFELISTNETALNIFSVSPCNRNPYFNMVELRDDGFVSLVKETSSFLSRQNAPKVFDMNASFYFYKRMFFDLNSISAITKFSLVFEMSHICFDLDEPIDFIFMEHLLSENLLDFKI